MLDLNTLALDLEEDSPNFNDDVALAVRTDTLEEFVAKAKELTQTGDAPLPWELRRKNGSLYSRVNTRRGVFLFQIDWMQKTAAPKG